LVSLNFLILALFGILSSLSRDRGRESSLGECPIRQRCSFLTDCGFLSAQIAADVLRSGSHGSMIGAANTRVCLVPRSVRSNRFGLPIEWQTRAQIHIFTQIAMSHLSKSERSIHYLLIVDKYLSSIGPTDPPNKRECIDKAKACSLIEAIRRRQNRQMPLINHCTQCPLQETISLSSVLN